MEIGAALVIGAGVVAALAAIVVSGLLIAGIRVPPVVGAAPVALPVIVAAVSTRMGFDTAADAAEAWPLEAWATMYASGMSAALAPVGVADLATGIPATLLVLGCAIAAAIRGPRNLFLAGTGLAVAILLPIVPIVVLVLTDTGAYTMVKIPVYGILGLLASVALLSGGPEKAGPEAAATGALALVFAVAGLEMASIGRDQILIHQAIGSAPAEMKTTMWAGGQALVGTTKAGAWIALALASLVAALGIGAVGGESVGRRLGGLAGAVLLLVGPLALILPDPVGPSVQARRAVHDRVFPAASDDLMLAESSSMRPARLGVGVVVTQRAILVDGTVIMELERTQHALQVPQSEKKGALISELYDVLLERAEVAKDVGARSMRDDMAFDGTILAQFDRNTPFFLAREVLYTAGQAQFGEFHFVVGGGGTPRVIEATLPRIAAPPDDDGWDEMPLNLAVVVSADGYSVMGSHPLLAEGAGSVPCLHASCVAPEDFDDDGLRRLLGMIKDEYPDEEQVIIVGTANTRWSAMVRAMDASREDPETRVDGRPRVLFPAVVLAGGAE
jgi:hypothetical protein